MYRAKQLSKRMVRQELRMSCGAACARQLLLDANIDLPERVIREEAAFNEKGIYASWLARALGKLHPGQGYQGGVLDPYEAAFRALLRRGEPFIVMLDEHWVIVDRADGTTVFIRDPGSDAEVGFECEMELGKFYEQWRLGKYQAVIRKV